MANCLHVGILLLAILLFLFTTCIAQSKLDSMCLQLKAGEYNFLASQINQELGFEYTVIGSDKKSVTYYQQNALQYALPPAMEGTAKISFQKENEDYVLQVPDSGIGLPSNFESNHSMGMNLVGILVEQLEGTMNIYNSPGTLFTIKFRDKRAA